MLPKVILINQMSSRTFLEDPPNDSGLSFLLCCRMSHVDATMNGENYIKIIHEATLTLIKELFPLIIDHCHDDNVSCC